MAQEPTEVDRKSKDLALCLKTLEDIRRMLVAYQRDEVMIFYNSQKCRRLCEEALAKCR